MSELPDNITVNDIKFILNNIWEVSESEWEVEDENQRMDSLSFILKKLTATKDGGYCKIWKTKNEEPIAILGAFLVHEKLFESFFIASKHMSDHALKLSFEMRQILKDESYTHKGCTLRLLSGSTHPKQLTWFRFLGFKYIPEHNVGNDRYFEYKSRIN